MLHIRTNRHWREFLTGADLTASERAWWVDLLTDEQIDDSSWIRYRGDVMTTADFIRVDVRGELGDWDGFAGDSWWTGTVIKLSSDGDQYQIGSYQYTHNPADEVDF